MDTSTIDTIAVASLIAYILLMNVIVAYLANKDLKTKREERHETK